jgi:CheY-like chemotaxis protein
VLVVDDEPVVRALVVAGLERSGLEVQTCADGASALAAARASTPDLKPARRWRPA